MYKLLLILCFLSFLESNDEYKLGEGVQLGTSPIYLGGYISLDYQNADDENRLRIDDFALMIYGDYDKFSFMSDFVLISLPASNWAAKEMEVKENKQIAKKAPFNNFFIVLKFNLKKNINDMILKNNFYD